ncbi:MAG: DUF6268 family outer membrane beta-barrel protein [Bacteroidetes bacterium]|jgi:hypothetical protein|nr:DUF6268 family outer membrane beta-barrel protein [Bacteroidota bacterium]
MTHSKILFLALCLLGPMVWTQAQTVDSSRTPQATEDEDFSMYDQVDFADQSARRYCSPKIEGLSPAKLISIGYDYQGGYGLGAGAFTNKASDYSWTPDSVNVLNSRGLRLGFNIPVVSRTNLVWQMGANYWEQRYDIEGLTGEPSNSSHPLIQSLQENGLRTLGVNTTLFKPLDDRRFLLFQGSADLNGDFSLPGLMPLKYLKYSAALIYGIRPNEKKQWGLGIARTYRVGELNYIPVFLFNWTDRSNKWGSEILFPARAHVRYTFNPRNMLFGGFELEGQSYRLWDSPSYILYNLRGEDLEIRRGEIRLRAMYEFSLKDFVWMSVQAGYRINYRYEVDRLSGGQEIYRAFGLLSDAPYVMENRLGNPLYFQVSVNLVSP